jgi:hypothetical protein
MNFKALLMAASLVGLNELAQKNKKPNLGSLGDEHVPEYDERDAERFKSNWSLTDPEPTGDDERDAERFRGRRSVFSSRNMVQDPLFEMEDLPEPFDPDNEERFYVAPAFILANMMEISAGSDWKGAETGNYRDDIEKYIRDFADNFTGNYTDSFPLADVLDEFWGPMTYYQAERLQGEECEVERQESSSEIIEMQYSPKYIERKHAVDVLELYNQMGDFYDRTTGGGGGWYWGQPYEHEGGQGGVLILEQLDWELFKITDWCIPPDSGHYEWMRESNWIWRYLVADFFPRMKDELDKVDEDENYDDFMDQFDYDSTIEGWELWRDFNSMESGFADHRARLQAEYYAEYDPAGRIRLEDFIQKGGSRSEFIRDQARQINTPEFRKNKIKAAFGDRFRDLADNRGYGEEWEVYFGDDGENAFERAKERIAQARRAYWQQRERERQQSQRERQYRSRTRTQTSTAPSSWDEDKGKKLLRKLAIVYHPDKGGSNEEMQLINDAYDRQDMEMLQDYADRSGINLNGMTLGQVERMYHFKPSPVRR